MANIGAGSVKIIDSDGDVVESDGNGRLKVLLEAGDLNIGNVDIVSAPTLTVNAHHVTNAGTFAVQVDGDALTSLQLLDDAIYVDDADWSGGSSKHMLVGGVYEAGLLSITDGDVSPLLLNATGSLVVDVVNGGVLETLVDGIETHLSEIEGAIETVEGCVTSNQIVIRHGITAISHGVKVVSTAGSHESLGTGAIRKIDIQAQTDNTGLIAVGGSGVDATEATGSGIILRAGDTYSFEVDNLNDIYIDSTVDGEGVRYTTFA